MLYLAEGFITLQSYLILSCNCRLVCTDLSQWGLEGLASAPHNFYVFAVAIIWTFISLRLRFSCVAFLNLFFLFVLPGLSLVELVTQVRHPGCESAGQCKQKMLGPLRIVIYSIQQVNWVARDKGPAQSHLIVITPGLLLECHRVVGQVTMILLEGFIG